MPVNKCVSEARNRRKAPKLATSLLLKRKVTRNCITNVKWYFVPYVWCSWSESTCIDGSFNPTNNWRLGFLVCLFGCYAGTGQHKFCKNHRNTFKHLLSKWIVVFTRVLWFSFKVNIFLKFDWIIFVRNIGTIKFSRKLPIIVSTICYRIVQKLPLIFDLLSKGQTLKTVISARNTQHKIL